MQYMTLNRFAANFFTNRNKETHLLSNASFYLRYKDTSFQHPNNCSTVLCILCEALVDARNSVDILNNQRINDADRTFRIHLCNNCLCNCFSEPIPDSFMTMLVPKTAKRQSIDKEPYESKTGRYQPDYYFFYLSNCTNCIISYVVCT